MSHEVGINDDIYKTYLRSDHSTLAFINNKIQPGISTRFHMRFVSLDGRHSGRHVTSLVLTYNTLY